MCVNCEQGVFDHLLFQGVVGSSGGSTTAVPIVSFLHATRVEGNKYAKDYVRRNLVLQEFLPIFAIKLIQNHSAHFCSILSQHKNFFKNKVDFAQKVFHLRVGNLEVKSICAKWINRVFLFYKTFEYLSFLLIA